MSSEVEKFCGESFGCAENLRMQINDNDECARIGDRLSRMVTEMMTAQEEILKLEAQLSATKTKEKLQSQSLHKKVEELEKKLLEKDGVVERLKLELEQTKELNISCEKIASETISELKKMKQEVELQESKNWDQCRYISLLETEVKQLMEESGKARDEVVAMNESIGKVKEELENIKTEAAHSKDRVLEAQVENALLKVELHKWRSKAAAAEAAKERCKSEKFALNRALQLAAASSYQLPSGPLSGGSPGQLKFPSASSYQLPSGPPSGGSQGPLKFSPISSYQVPSGPPSESQGRFKSTPASSYQVLSCPLSESQGQFKSPPASSYQFDTNNNNVIIISRNEYEALINNENHQEKLGKLGKELTIATRKIREFRTRAEQAISRAEAAEKAKVELEIKIKRRKEEEKKKKDFFEKLREEVKAREATSPDFEVKNTPAIQTLSNVLEIPL